jgi:hypothetical protein
MILPPLVFPDFTFNRALWVGLVNQDKVDVAEVEVEERFLDGFNDFLPVE